MFRFVGNILYLLSVSSDLCQSFFTRMSENTPLMPLAGSTENRPENLLNHQSHHLRESQSLIIAEHSRAAEKEPFKGMILMAMSALTFSIMSALVKEAGARFHFTSSQIVFYRSLIQMILAIFACRKVGVSPTGPEGFKKSLLVARGSFGAIALGLYFFTLLIIALFQKIIL